MSCEETSRDLREPVSVRSVRLHLHGCYAGGLARVKVRVFLIAAILSLQRVQNPFYSLPRIRKDF